MICSVCSVCGVHRTTPCTAGSRSVSAKDLNGTLCSAANAAAFGSGSTTHATSSFALVLISGTMIRPHHPRPQTATFSIGPRFSIDGCAGFARRAAPAVAFLRHEVGERGRRGAGHHLDAAVREPLAHLALLHRLHYYRVELVDDRLRRAGRHEDALPRAALEAGEARLLHRRHVG